MIGFKAISVPSAIYPQPGDSHDSSPENVDGALPGFADSVYATMFSRAEGYDNLGELLRHLRYVPLGFQLAERQRFSEDTNRNAEEEARRFGYDSFTAFLRSPSMSGRVLVERTADGGILFKAMPNETNRHLRREQEISMAYAVNRWVN